MASVTNGQSESGFPPFSEVMESSSDQESKPWLKRTGGPISKVAPDVKRRRRNYRFKKLLAPKNPLMILNELKTGLVYTISDNLNPTSNTISFTATVEYEPGMTFTGTGVSKKLAQQAAAEEALRGLYFNKMLETLPAKIEEDKDDKMDGNNPEINTTSASPATEKTPVLEDDTPWCSLASLALFKLINEWQSSGCMGYTLNMNAGITPAKKEPEPPKDNGGLRKIPENALQMDPVMLLNQISPESKFSAFSLGAMNGEQVFKIEVNFNGNVFTGEGNKKKEAKKVCARKALKTVGVYYPEN